MDSKGEDDHYEKTVVRMKIRMRTLSMKIVVKIWIKRTITTNSMQTVVKINNFYMAMVKT